MPNDKKVDLPMSNLPIAQKAKKIWDDYCRSKGTKGELLQQMLYHCEKTGFNADTSPLEWKEDPK